MLAWRKNSKIDMPYGLDDATVEKIRQVFVLYPEIDKVVIYGSRAMGRQRDGSDIDLTFFGKQLDRNTLNRIESALDELNLPYMIDASNHHDIKTQSLKAHIERVGVVFFERAKSREQG